MRERSPKVVRPERELRAFAKVSLAPGETATVRFELGRCDFARHQPITRRSLVQDFLGRPGGQAAYAEMLRALGFGGLLEPEDEVALARLSAEQLAAKRKGDGAARAFANEMPLYKIPAMSGGLCGDARIDELVRAFGLTKTADTGWPAQRRSLSGTSPRTAVGRR